MRPHRAAHQPASIEARRGGDQEKGLVAILVETEEEKPKTKTGGLKIRLLAIFCGWI